MDQQVSHRALCSCTLPRPDVFVFVYVCRRILSMTHPCTLTSPMTDTSEKIMARTERILLTPSFNVPVGTPETHVDPHV